MGILIKKIRIENYRSIESLDLNLNYTNILLGQNNSGKSNFLNAIGLVFSKVKSVNQSDIYLAKDELLNFNKKAIIDIMIKPTNDKGKIEKNFSDFWNGTFTESWISTDVSEGDYVGVRTIIQYDLVKDIYTCIQYSIKEWNTTILESKISNRKFFNNEMIDLINCYYMDAQRDAVNDLKNNNSYIGKFASYKHLEPEIISELETDLNLINNNILEKIPALKEAEKKIAEINHTMNRENSIISIEPLARKLNDLHKGMDITMTDGNSNKFSLSSHGMGTRSWVTFLTLGAFIDWSNKNIKKDDDEAETLNILTLEEPEAHLHPQAQKQLYKQITQFEGQKFISTHSPNIAAQADLINLIHFEKDEGKSLANNFDNNIFNDIALDKIKREVVNTRGELLFSSAIILCEGITEEQSLPIFFEEYFGIEPIFLGINIIGIGGQNYETFLNLIKQFNISWFIFSDGEENSIKIVNKAVKSILPLTTVLPDNVIVLENDEDYEKHLINSNYKDNIIKGICICEDDSEYFHNYVLKNNHQKNKRRKANLPKCEKCNQDIYVDNFRNYDGEDGIEQALYDCCTGKRAKAKYASYIAMEIVKHEDKEKRIPPKILDLFKIIEKELKIVREIEI